MSVSSQNRPLKDSLIVGILLHGQNFLAPSELYKLPNGHFFFIFFSILLFCDLGVSQGHQSDDEDKDDYNEDEVKDDKDDNEEA